MAASDAGGDPALGRRPLDAAPVLALLLDDRAAVRHVNPHGERVTGWSLAELAGADWIDRLLPDDSRAAAHQRFAAAIAGEPMRTLLAPIVTRSGERRLVDWRATRCSTTRGAAPGCSRWGSASPSSTQRSMPWPPASIRAFAGRLQRPPPRR